MGDPRWGLGESMLSSWRVLYPWRSFRRTIESVRWAVTREGGDEGGLYIVNTNN